MGTAIGAGMAAANEQEEDLTLLATPAVVMAPRTDGAEIVCAVKRLCRARVEWKSEDGGTGKAAINSHGFVPQGEELIKVRLDGLEPGKSYQIRLIVESADEKPERREETAWKPFKTLNPDADECRFAVWNDTHENVETLRLLHEVTPEADFLIWNGDTCNDWHRKEQLIPTILNPGGCDITHGRPLLISCGNHDVRGRWAFHLEACTAYPEGRPFHAFRQGPVAVICLHTGEDKPDSHPGFAGRVAFEPLRREQAEWLKEVTTRPEIRDAPHKVVFCHIPLRWTTEVETVDYAGGQWDHYSRSSRDAWHDSLVQWGAQVVISGHTHREGWLPANEKFPYAQLVSGGPRPDAARWIEGLADASGLRLVMRDLTGKTTMEHTFPRL